MSDISVMYSSGNCNPTLQRLDCQRDPNYCLKLCSLIHLVISTTLNFVLLFSASRSIFCWTNFEAAKLILKQMSRFPFQLLMVNSQEID